MLISQVTRSYPDIIVNHEILDTLHNSVRIVETIRIINIKISTQ